VSFVNPPVADLFGSQFTIEYWANPGSDGGPPTWGYVGSSIFNTNDPIRLLRQLADLRKRLG